MANKKKMKKAAEACQNGQQSDHGIESLTNGVGGLAISTPNALANGQRGTPTTKIRNVVKAFDQYFGKGDLESWKRLCLDVGVGAEFTSITQCRKVWSENKRGREVADVRLDLVANDNRMSNRHSRKSTSTSTTSSRRSGAEQRFDISLALQHSHNTPLRATGSIPRNMPSRWDRWQHFSKMSFGRGGG
jgi:hypothetical protein